MARVLYGIHGTGHGHAMRGLTIARRLRQHEFLFVADDDAPRILEAEFPVSRLPNLGTVFKNYKVDLRATIARAVPLLLRRQRHIDQVLRLMDEFRPDVCMTDLEYFVPRAAEQAGLPCLTLDHQHIITCCRHNLPPGMWWDAFLQGLTARSGPAHGGKPDHFFLCAAGLAALQGPRGPAYPARQRAGPASPRRGACAGLSEQFHPQKTCGFSARGHEEDLLCLRL